MVWAETVADMERRHPSRNILLLANSKANRPAGRVGWKEVDSTFITHSLSGLMVCETAQQVYR
ncbi:hypothetical protein GCM10023189_02650 [Nibrella saemangeumensis]|uniref:Uncharacterized protein n=1 Tax=Nibrella saemangeumensis TaxID=1084526 RepID=A0ABP8MC12_9BACT